MRLAARQHASWVLFLCRALALPADARVAMLFAGRAIALAERRAARRVLSTGSVCCARTTARHKRSLSLRRPAVDPTPPVVLREPRVQIPGHAVVRIGCAWPLYANPGYNALPRGLFNAAAAASTLVVPLGTFAKGLWHGRARFEGSEGGRGARTTRGSRGWRHGNLIIQDQTTQPYSVARL